MSDNNLQRTISTANGSVVIQIDANSGFCFGVVNAIQLAEVELRKSGSLFSLGNIVHNDEEVNRLNKIGLRSMSKDEFNKNSNQKVLFRAHGEPQSSYDTAKQNNIELIDATCPVVLKLQQRIKEAWEKSKIQNKQVVIYGKHGHAEVLGLLGQTNNEAIVVQNEDDISKLDKNKGAIVFSQTTMSVEEYKHLSGRIDDYLSSEITVHDTICRQVSNRAPKMKEFVKQHDAVLFVGGVKSSNAKYLYSICKKQNKATVFISSANEIDKELLKNKTSVGICGATSTPMWLMQEVADRVELFVKELN